jgi:hypothetical protein
MNTGCATDEQFQPMSQVGAEHLVSNALGAVPCNNEFTNNADVAGSIHAGWTGADSKFAGSNSTRVGSTGCETIANFAAKIVDVHANIACFVHNKKQSTELSDMATQNIEIIIDECIHCGVIGGQQSLRNNSMNSTSFTSLDKGNLKQEADNMLTTIANASANNEPGFASLPTASKTSETMQQTVETIIGSSQHEDIIQDAIAQYITSQDVKIHIGRMVDSDGIFITQNLTNNIISSQILSSILVNFFSQFERSDIEDAFDISAVNDPDGIGDAGKKLLDGAASWMLAWTMPLAVGTVALCIVAVILFKGGSNALQNAVNLHTLSNVLRLLGFAILGSVVALIIFSIDGSTSGIIISIVMLTLFSSLFIYLWYKNKKLKAITSK